MMPSKSGAERLDGAAAQGGTAAATAAPAGGGPDPETSSASPEQHLSRLTWPQVKRLDALLSEPIPIHGRGNFPTLSVQPRQIVQVSGGWGWGGGEGRRGSVLMPACRQGSWSLFSLLDVWETDERERVL